MADLKALKQERTTLKGLVTRMGTAMEANLQMSASQATIRLRKLEEYSKQYEQLQQQIEACKVADDTKEAFDQANENDRLAFETKYYDLADKLQQNIDAERIRLEDRWRANVGNQQNAQQPNDNTGPSRGETIHVTRNRVKLPEMKLGEFSGEWSDWVFFRNRFESTIIKDEDLTDMQRFQYLLGVLKGEACKVVAGLEINGANFPIAWQMLKDTYNNEMMIIESHLEALLNLPNVTKENKAQSIKDLIWHIKIHLQSLKALSQPVDQWDSVIIHLARKKLDYIEQKEWQDRIRDKTPQNMPTLTEFIKFLTERCHTLRIIAPTSDKQTPSNTTNTTRPAAIKRTERKDDKKVTLVATNPVCAVCDGEHHISRCEDFLKLTTSDRKRTAMEKKLCLNCLRRGHLGRDCYASTCRKCEQKHNTLLHSEDTKKPEGTGSTLVSVCTEDESTDVVCYCTRKQSTQVILSTVQVHVCDIRGNRLTCRALLDPGSQVNLITDKMARKLNLPYTKESRLISGVQQAHSSASKVVQLTIASKTGNFKTVMECVVLSSITERLPQTKIDTSKIRTLKDITLADPTYHEPGDIDLLIGAGLFWQLIQNKPVNQVEGQPFWQETKLGWIVGGEIRAHGPATSKACLKVTNARLGEQLERFWLQEALPDSMPLSKEEKYCEQHFMDTMQRESDGRFKLRLPLRPEVKLGESKPQALRRFQSLERRFDKNPDLANAYAEFMDDYIRQGHMSQVIDLSKLESRESYYIPHQPVIRPDSLTTRLRVVFDASAKSSSGASLNDKLVPGPNLQGDLVQILIRFRTHQVVLTGDIAQMYRQVLIHPDDRRYQLILWRKNKNEKIQVFELNTITYGEASAPFQAIRTVRELARIYKHKYPLAAAAILKDFYMDDGLSGARTIQQVRELLRQLYAILLEGQFLMRKWRSNEPEVLQEIQNSQIDDELLVLDKEDAMKTLGLLWNAQQDTLQYEVTLSQDSANTKRSILSKISQVFDPLGLVSPVLLHGKLFMQKLWASEMDWDESLTEEYLSQWNNYYSSLSQLNQLRIPRNVNPMNHTDQVDLYGFGDASERGFGACIYAVSQNEQGSMEAHLVSSRSKVAPLKSISLPRLELEAALLLAKLTGIVRESLGDKVGTVHLYSDSTIVLSWLKMEPNRMKTFVANRISKIQEQTEQMVWSHVPTKENPADLISRGTSVETLTSSSLWWHGPPWLRDPSQRPPDLTEPDTDLPEMRSTEVALVTTWSSRILTKYSSFRKLCRVVAHCFRFIRNCRKGRRTGALDVQEIQQAEYAILKLLQRDVFSEELHCLEVDRILPRKSRLRAMNVFLGGTGLIQVGGRLRNATIPEAAKHQIVLAPNHHITKAIMQEEHQRLKHCPPEQLLHSVRQKYWPISGRRLANCTVKKCLKCFKFNPRIPEVLMGDLPAERVAAFDRPFTTTGVDYAGPIQVRESKRRGRMHISKGYIAVFVCLSTKAVHLELVSDLTTECFLAALTRFTVRRGICSKIFSDNGSNFVGAARELREVHEFLLKEHSEIASFLQKQKVDWYFIPPRAPHFGGLWEATVKMTKRHLSTETQGKVFTFEEYYTLLTEIEAVLNSRPLTPLSNHPDDLSAMTPSHFILGDSLTQPGRINLLGVSENRLSRWQHLQQMKQRLWLRWQQEYLQELQRRAKWCTSGPNIAVDTLVLLVEDNCPPLYWPMGRITAIHPGPDGVVRVVTVKTSTGIYKRPVKKVCPLPDDDDDEGASAEQSV